MTKFAVSIFLIVVLTGSLNANDNFGDSVSADGADSYIGQISQKYASFDLNQFHAVIIRDYSPDFDSDELSLLPYERQIEILKIEGLLPALKKYLLTGSALEKSNSIDFIQAMTKTNFFDWNPGTPNAKAQNLLLATDGILAGLGGNFIPLAQLNAENQRAIISLPNIATILQGTNTIDAMFNLSILCGRHKVDSDYINKLDLGPKGIPHFNPFVQTTIVDSPALMTLIGNSFSKNLKSDDPIFSAQVVADVVFKNKYAQQKVVQNPKIMNGLVAMTGYPLADKDYDFLGYAIRRAGITALYHLVSNNIPLHTDLLRQYPTLRPTLIRASKNLSSSDPQATEEQQAMIQAILNKKSSR